MKATNEKLTDVIALIGIKVDAKIREEFGQSKNGSNTASTSGIHPLLHGSRMAYIEELYP